MALSTQCGLLSKLFEIEHVIWRHWLVRRPGVRGGTERPHSTLY